MFSFQNYPLQDFKESKIEVKEESQSLYNPVLNIRQRGERTNRPKRRPINKFTRTSDCKKVLDDLLKAMNPLLNTSMEKRQYWYFGRHVTERLNAMRKIDAECASREIVQLLENTENTTQKSELDSFG